MYFKIPRRFRLSLFYIQGLTRIKGVKNTEKRFELISMVEEGGRTGEGRGGGGKGGREILYSRIEGYFILSHLIASLVLYISISCILEFSKLYYCQVFYTVRSKIPVLI